MKILLNLLLVFSIIGCSSFQAKRLNDAESDEKALEITDKWIQKDTELQVAKIIKQIKSHKGFKRYLRNKKFSAQVPTVFIGEIQNKTSEAYFPINDINDEFLNAISASGDFILVDAAARESILKEITYQNDGMVNPETAKRIGNQTGADLIIFGNVFMRPHRRDGKTIKQYALNLRMTDIEKGLEVVRTRVKVSKYSEQSSSSW